MITERTKAILLFTSYLSKDMDRNNKPLSLTEWNKLVRWLKAKDANPEAFLSESSSALLDAWNDQTISRNRLSGLLERKTALAIALDKWTRAGVWVISRSDYVFPKKLKEKLKELAPNILFGIGDQNLLEKQYLAVVGSRNADEPDLLVAGNIGRQVTKQRYGIVSGGAKGIDEAAMVSALETGGSCLGVLADSLIRKSTASIYRTHIIKRNLVLISPYNPEAGFNAGNAMGRNKLIYALAEGSVVVISDVKGGTWEGAKENLRNNWTPLWVCPSSEKGNKEIIKLGGHLLPDLTEIDVKLLVNPGSLKTVENTLFTTPSISAEKQFLYSQTIVNKPGPTTLHLDTNADSIKPISIKLSEMMSFDFFLFKWFDRFQYSPVSKTELGESLQLHLKQVEIWLELALNKGYALNKRKGNGQSWVLKQEVKFLSTGAK